MLVKRILSAVIMIAYLNYFMILEPLRIIVCFELNCYYKLVYGCISLKVVLYANILKGIYNILWNTHPL